MIESRRNVPIGVSRGTDDRFDPRALDESAVGGLTVHAGDQS